MTWLQGGPFLEVSFLLILDSDRQAFVDNILTKLKSFNPAVEFVTSESELKQKITEFAIGYPDDEKDPATKVYYQTQIPLYAETDVKRKSILSLRQISSKLVAIDFWFFGSELDAPEWNQAGLTNQQFPIFKDFLNKLFDTFHFLIGTVGYEVSVTDLFDTDDTWPSEKYTLEGINKKALQVDNYFSFIVANKQYIDLHNTDGVLTVGQRQTLGT